MWEAPARKSRDIHFVNNLNKERRGIDEGINERRTEENLDRRLRWSSVSPASCCCCCHCFPLSSNRKYYKRLRQSLTTFWAVMMITRNTIKRRHWRKVDERPPTLATLLCHKHPLFAQHWQGPPSRTWPWFINTPPSPVRDNTPTSMFGGKVSSFCKRDLLPFSSKQC